MKYMWPASWSISRKPASIPAIRPASLPSFSLSLRPGGPDCRPDRSPGPRIARRRPDEHSVCHQGNDIYILEVNPRASRTGALLSPRPQASLPYLATRVMLGKTLDELDPWSMRKERFYLRQGSGNPFGRFPGVDVILRPEMHSTGEVMGMGKDFSGKLSTKPACRGPETAGFRARCSFPSTAGTSPGCPKLREFSDLGFRIICHKRRCKGHCRNAGIPMSKL